MLYPKLCYNEPCYEVQGGGGVVNYMGVLGQETNVSFSRNPTNPTFLRPTLAFLTSEIFLYL